MLVDVVVDTNVLFHADNVSSKREKEAASFLRAVLAGDTALCLDGRCVDGVYQVGSSLIEEEYLRHAGAMSLGSAFVAQMASQGRVTYVSRDVSARVRKWINQEIYNKRDRTFVRAAARSCEKVLVSHDFADFPPATRAACRKRLSVDVLDSLGATARVSDGSSESA